MKKQTIALVTIIGFFAVIIILLLKNSEHNVTNVYCGESTMQPLNCYKKPVPNKLSADNTMLYYKVDDNCNFQTLVFDASKENAYSVLGRFTGRKIHKSQYQIDELEVIAYNLKDGTIGHYMVSDVKIGEMTENHVEFEIEMIERKEKSFNQNPDYIYHENPIIINSNSMISFDVDFPDEPHFTTGGYECNGKPVTSGGQ